VHFTEETVTISALFKHVLNKVKTMNLIKIASWNVNSVRARLDSILPWIETHQPDVLAMQETKVENDHFPAAVFEELGYHTMFHGQKSYNGVAIISRNPVEEVCTSWPGDHNDLECRLLVGTFNGIRIINVYVPNGQSIDSEKYTYKLEWLKRLRDFVEEELAQHPNMIILGDFNIAPKDDDVYDPKVWQDCVLVSDLERQGLERLFRLGFQDSYRLFDHPKDQYSWWDYRAAAFRRNMGLRIDLILVSGALTSRCVKSEIDKTPRSDDKPSDHAPVWIHCEALAKDE